MRVLFVVSTLAGSGPTNQLYSLIRNLDRRSFDPFLLTMSPEPRRNSAWGQFERLGVKIDTLGLSRVRGLLFSVSRTRRFVSEVQPDLVHTQGFRADSLSVSALKGLPSVCTSRNYPLADYPSKFGRLRGTLMAQRHIQVLKKLNVVACSHAIGSQLRTHGISANVVQNGVDAQKFRPVDTVDKAALRRRLGLPEDGIVLLSVGGLIPRKDMLTVVEAFEAANLGEKARLVVLGDGPQESVLRAQAGATVLFKGHVDNVKDYLSAADVFVSGSLSEGLPNTVLEAMASGLPCILSDIPSHRELQEDENWFFSCRDVSGLAGKLASISESDLSLLGCVSRARVEKQLSAERMAAEYQEVYLKVMGQRDGK